MTNNAFLHVSDAFIEENKLWMLTKEADALCKFDLENGTMEKCYYLPTGVQFEYGHLVMRNIDNYIYILPFNDSHMYCFEKDKESFRELEIICDGNDMLQNQKCRIIGCYDNKIVLITNDAKDILFIDQDSLETTKISGHISEMSNQGINVESNIFSDCYLQQKNMLYVPIYMHSYILAVDMDKQTYKLHCLSKDKKIKLRTIDKGLEENQFLLTTTDNERIIWSLNDGIKSIYKFKNTNRVGRYVRAYSLNDAYYYIPTHERKIYVERDGDVSEIPFKYPDMGDYAEYEFTQYECIFCHDGKIYIQARSNGAFYVLDPKGDNVVDLNIGIPVENKSKLIKDSYEVRGIPDIIWESYGLELSDYLKII